LSHLIFWFWGLALLAVSRAGKSSVGFIVVFPGVFAKEPS
jgi:hypothetical protein